MWYEANAHNPVPWLPHPFANVAAVPPAAARPPLSHRLADLLLTDAVQKVSFTVGHVIVLPAKFRAVSEALRDGRITVLVDPARLANEGSVAMYLNNRFWGHENAFMFASDAILDTPTGRATAVHEALHAAMDIAAQGTAIRNEEGAAFVMECLYAKNTGMTALGGVTQTIMDVASDLWSRMEGGERPARATATQINALRREMATSFGYENAHYSHDGA